MKGPNLGIAVVENGSNVVENFGPGDHEGGIVGPAIKIKVCHGPNQHDLTVPSQSTFGDLKRVIAQEIGLDTKEQKLLFRGNEKDDQEYLHMAGLRDNAKVLLMENKASEAAKVEEVKESRELPRGYAAVAEIRPEVDKLSAQVAAIERTVYNGTKVADKEFIVLTELLMRQLLKLDGIDAEGEGKVQRKIEVSRVQSLVEKLDTLKERNSNPFAGSSNVTVTTNWETFESGAESQSAPPTMPPSTKVTEVESQSVLPPMPSSRIVTRVDSQSVPPPMPSSTKVTQDWEVFE